MKKFLIIVFLIITQLVTYSQKLNQVSFRNGSDLNYFTIITDQDVLVRIAPDGKILEWGYEELSSRGTFYAPKLQPFLGRTDYFGDESDTFFKGKLKSIGTAYLTYYGPHEEELKKGKLKSIGKLELDYYSRFDEKNIQGKLKFIGHHLIEYYKAFENEAYRGKLKTLGPLAVTYYSLIDDRYNIGKLKTIGSISYAWHTPLDRNKSGLKSFNYRSTISGITMVLR
jgi:hypothetical protein